jgi:hypothetical protein
MTTLLIVWIVILSILSYFGYKAYRNQIENIERNARVVDELSKQLDNLWNYEHFLEVNATENYFPKEV